MTENELLRMLWRGRYLVAASLVLSILAAVAVTAKLPRVYQASGIVQVEPTDVTQASPGELPALQQVSQGLAASYATLLDSNAFLLRLRNRAPERFTLAQLRGDLSASAMTVNNSTTNLIKIVATGDSPDAAVRLARNVSNAFVAQIRHDADVRANAQRTEISAQIDALSARIATLRAKTSATAVEQVQSLTASRSALASRLAAVVANQISAGQSVSVVAPPTADAGPISPHPSLNLMIGALLGLLAGVGLAWLRDRIDTGLESARQAEELLGVPNLATIPKVSHDRSPGGDYFAREAYELLRANFGFLALEHDLKVVTVTSYNPGEGKSSAAEGFAAAAVRGGLRVLLVDGDLRTSELSHRLRPSEIRLRGLTNLVLAVAGRRRNQRAGETQDSELSNYLVPLHDGLSLLPAGVRPPNPASFLSGSAVARVFELLRRDFDLVIVDSPPVSHLADASLLAAHSDGVIVVARVGVAKRQDLVAAAASLRHLPTPIVGCVVFDERSAAGEEYYGIRTPRSGERLSRRAVAALRAVAFRQAADASGRLRRGSRPVREPRSPGAAPAPAGAVEDLAAASPRPGGASAAAAPQRNTAAQ